MKILRVLITGLTVSFLPILLGGGTASGASQQTVKWTVIGDCVDMYDEYQTTYTVYEGDNCYFKVTVKPAKPQRTVALQWYSDDDGRWVTEDEKKTNIKTGVATLYLDEYDSDGYFFDGEYEYRLGVARLGSLPAKLSPTFYVDFVSG
jgi:hypothetical protein